jgi:hypothetical protein
MAAKDEEQQPKTVVLVDPVTRQRVEEPAPGPNASTEVTDEHFFLSTDGRRINSFGEEIGSDEDKRRRASR